jgi:hypothetical protein
LLLALFFGAVRSLATAVRPHRRGGVGLAGFPFRLETEDGAPAEPRQLTSVVPIWDAGDTIHLGKRTLRVIGKREDDADRPPVLIVEEVAGIGHRTAVRRHLDTIPPAA